MSTKLNIKVVIAGAVGETVRCWVMPKFYGRRMTVVDAMDIKGKCL